MTAHILRADARRLPLPDASVDLIVTSPPYYALRSYTDTPQLCARCRELSDGFLNPGDAHRNLRQAWPDWDAHVAAEHKPAHYDGQIGSEPTPAEYIDNLIACTREWIRVLKPTGSCWVNLGDKYSGAQAQNVGGANRAGDSARTWTQTDPRRTGIPNKSLMGLPWRYALRCIDDLGLILRAEIIWSKPNGLPESVTDRVRRSHEQWFWLSTWAPEGPPPDLIRAVLEQVAAGVLTVDEAERLLTLDMTSHEVWFHATKQPRYYSAIDHIRQPHAAPTLGRNPHGARGAHYRVGSDGLMTNGKGSHPTGVDGHLGFSPLGALPGSVWEIATEPLTVPDHLGVDHFAAFPTEWPRRIILGWSPSGICTACGEGRRPVVDNGPARGDFNGNARDARAGRSSNGAERNRIYRERVAVGIAPTITGEACACPDTTAPTQPSLILDPFGGTGTTALVAHAYGRTGITIDKSADYSRLAAWRTTDPDQLAKAMRVDKPPKQLDGQAGLFDIAGGGL